jgi:hypothetical protein
MQIDGMPSPNTVAQVHITTTLVSYAVLVGHRLPNPHVQSANALTTAIETVKEIIGHITNRPVET